MTSDTQVSAPAVDTPDALNFRESGLKPAHCLALTAALCLSAVAHAAVPAPAPAERQVVADAGKRLQLQAAPAAKAKEEAPKQREAAPRNADKTEVDFTLHWYN